MFVTCCFSLRQKSNKKSISVQQRFFIYIIRQFPQVDLNSRFWLPFILCGEASLQQTAGLEGILKKAGDQINFVQSLRTGQVYQNVHWLVEITEYSWNITLLPTLILTCLLLILHCLGYGILYLPKTLFNIIYIK